MPEALLSACAARPGDQSARVRFDERIECVNDQTEGNDCQQESPIGLLCERRARDARTAALWAILAGNRCPRSDRLRTLYVRRSVLAQTGLPVAPRTPIRVPRA